MMCNSCHQEIQPGRGVIVQGNIMVYEKEYPKNRGGLIGSLKYEPMKVEDVPEHIFCVNCFYDATIGVICGVARRK